MADDSFSDTETYSETAVPYRETGSDLDSFLHGLYAEDLPDFATFSFVIDAIDPLAYLEMCWQKNTFQYYWEKPVDDFAVAAGGELLNLSASGSDRFNTMHRKVLSIRERSAEYSAVPHPYSGMMFLGGFSFYDEIGGSEWQSFDPASFTVPEWTIVKDGKFSLLTLSVEVGRFDTKKELDSYLKERFEEVRKTCDIQPSGEQSEGNMSSVSNQPLPQNGNSHYRHWTTSVNSAKQLISEGEFEKIVLARELEVSLTRTAAPTEILNRLRSQYTGCYSFLIHKPDNRTFLGSTPERLGSFRNHLLLTEALAGSIERGETATEDAILEKNLTASTKNRNEHNFVIKDIEQRLSPFARSIERSPHPEIKKLLNVQHLYTPIRAQLSRNTHMLEVIGKLHPTPAVGGYPWEQAAPHLEQLENFNRGWYASPVGWINSKGMGEFAVGIRSGLLSDGKARFYAGCGIVADSDADAEWKETNLKLRPMLSALQYD